MRACMSACGCACERRSRQSSAALALLSYDQQRFFFIIKVALPVCTAHEHRAHGAVQHILSKSRWQPATCALPSLVNVDIVCIDTNYIDTNYIDTNYIDTNYIDTNYIDTNNLALPAGTPSVLSSSTSTLRRRRWRSTWAPCSPRRRWRRTAKQRRGSRSRPSTSRSVFSFCCCFFGIQGIQAG